MIVMANSSSDDGRDPAIVMYGMIAYRFEPGITATVSQEQIIDLNLKLYQAVTKIVMEHGLMVSNPDMMLEHLAQVRETAAGYRLSEESPAYLEMLTTELLASAFEAWGMKKLESKQEVTVWENWAYEKDSWYKSKPAELMEESMRVEASIGDDFTPSRVLNVEKSQVQGAVLLDCIEPGWIPVRKKA